MGTSLNTANVLEFPLQILSTAPLSAPLPTAPWPTALDTAFSVLGRVTDSGYENARDLNTTTLYDSTGTLAFEGDNQLRETITCTALETNNVTEGLKYPNAVKTTLTSGTPEVQTVTVTGTPTGGTFTPIYNGTATSSPVAYNAATTALQTALRTIPALSTATVGGSPGAYTVTFPASEGNASALTFVNALTGGTTPGVTVAETTPGVLPVYKWVTTSSGILSTAKRLYVLDEVNLASGRAQRKAFVGKAKATGLGAATAGTPKQTPFTIVKYEDLLIGGLEAIVSTLDAHNPAAAGF